MYQHPSPPGSDNYLLTYLYKHCLITWLPSGELCTTLLSQILVTVRSFEEKLEMNLAGKKAFVVGGTSGIGLAAAARLTTDGAEVTISGRSKNAHSVANQHGFANGVQLDVTDERSVDVNLTRQRYDILVVSAGISPSTMPKGWGRHAQRRLLMEVNHLGAMACIEACTPQMVEAGYGRVIFVGSAAGLERYKTYGPYGASKAALHQDGRVAALDLSGTGVTVNGVCPGFVNTPMTTDIPDEVMAGMMPIGRVLEDHEVADAIAFYCGESAAGISGNLMRLGGV